MPSLEFTMMVGCPLMCTFCPQDKLRASYGNRQKYFQLDDFRAILAKTPKHVRIDFSGMAEPWTNPDCTHMLAHTLHIGFNVAIYTTMHGMLDPEHVACLLRDHAGQVEVLCLHLPDAAGNMRGWKPSREYDFALATMLTLQPVLGNRFEIMTMDAAGRPHPDLGSDALGAWTGVSRAGNVDPDEVKGPMHPPPRHGCAVSCSFTSFYDQNVVLPNGDVVLCCQDYSLQHRIGNLLEMGYYEMFETSAGLGQLQAENMRPEFSITSLCKTCDRAKQHHLGPGHHIWR